MELTVIITARNEAKTVSRLVHDIGSQIRELSIESEIILVCPDRETARAGLKADRNHLVHWLKDKARGKPVALNQAFPVAKGKIWLLTDGDVLLGKGAIAALLKGLDDQNVGLVSGRPMAQNPKSYIFGYWAHLLTEMAHQERLKQRTRKKYLDASGYLMALRGDLINRIPPDSLADDTVISRMVWKKGLIIDYQPQAQVLVKFPNNLKDWLTQKKRTLGGQVGMPGKARMRSFTREAFGVFSVFSYSKGLKQIYWTLLLIFARLYLWIVVFFERKVINKPFDKTWIRVSSTK